MEKSEQELFINFLKNNDNYNHWYPVFAVMLGTGMRVGEVTGLRWQDIDFDKNIISVNHTLVNYSRGKGKGNVFAVNPPKTKSGVTVCQFMRSYEIHRKPKSKEMQGFDTICRAYILPPNNEAFGRQLSPKTLVV